MNGLYLTFRRLQTVALKSYLRTEQDANLVFSSSFAVHSVHPQISIEPFFLILGTQKVEKL